MGNGNTNYAHHRGHSGMKHLRSGAPKDWGVSGPKVNSAEERAKRGRKAWVGASPPKRVHKPRGGDARKGVKQHG